MSTRVRQFVIHGVTESGSRFRPSDWAERLAGVMAQFRPAGSAGNHLTYSPYVLPVVIDGVRGIPPQLRDTVKAFRIPLALRFRRVLVMAALPQIMAGIRIAIAVALVLMVISEFFGASVGVGFYINEAKQRFAMPETWAGTVLIGILGYVLSALFLRLERWLLAWYFQDSRTQGDEGA